MPPMSRLAGCVLAAILSMSFAPAAIGRDDQAARFYEDARSRLGRGDTAGAIIQLKNALREDSSLLAAQALLGQAFMRNQQPDQAQEALERAIALGIDKSEVALTLAEALLAQGKVRDLIDRLPPEVVQGPARADLLVLRGHAFRQLGEPTTAERSFEQARAVDPSSVNALLSLAEHIGQRGQRDEALALVARAAGIAPGNPKVWFVKGALLQQGGDRNGAVEAYSRALTIQPQFADARVARVSLLLGRGDDAAVMRDLDYFAKEQPDEPRGNYLRAVRLGQKGDGEGARAALAAAARVLAPVPPEVLKRRAPELLMLAALVFHGLNEHERARAYLDAVLGVAPGDLAALKLLGSIYLGDQDFVSAVKVLEPAQRKAPADPQLMLLLGEAYMGRGRVAAAAELLERAFRLRGGSTEIQTAYGVSLLRGGQRDAGVQQLRAAFDKDPGQARAGMALAVAYLASGDGKRATATMERVVQRSPDNPAYLNTLGVLRQAIGDRAGSRAAYEGALRVVPGFVPARLNLGRLDVQEGHFDAAAGRYAALLKDEPKSVETMHEFALLERRRGQAAAARQWLEKGRATDPAFRPVAFALIDANLESKQPAKALEIALDLEGRAPEDLDVLARSAQVRLAAGDRAGAQSVLARMTRLAQIDPDRQVEIARLQIAAGNPSAAAYSLEKALSGRPDDLAAQVRCSSRWTCSADRRMRPSDAREPSSYRSQGVASDTGCSVTSSSAAGGHPTRSRSIGRPSPGSRRPRTRSGCSQGSSGWGPPSRRWPSSSPGRTGIRTIWVPPAPWRKGISRRATIRRHARGSRRSCGCVPMIRWFSTILLTWRPFRATARRLWVLPSERSRWRPRMPARATRWAGCWSRRGLAIPDCGTCARLACGIHGTPRRAITSRQPWLRSGRTRRRPRN
jgi:putative PEP-CTERM system TPR-repeat lipoprotein